MGASIGYALPVGIGAAIAAPDRKTIVLSGHGSAMYTLQSLWTMAREQLDVTIVVFANRSYEILRGELSRDPARPRLLRALPYRTGLLILMESRDALA